MKPTKEPAVASAPNAQCADYDAPRFADAQALERYCDSRIARELERCRARMSEAEWAEHRAWIEANARVSLLEALRARANRGEL
ncbi:hypothetical protein [Paraburkholderia youngii]|uniref:hypothetical protein n=1 Tax=Paraburkholderia youngii TaxID=2782701 RepID=UPI003D24DA47